jgi:lipoyl(octanoyl) transferase
MTLQTTILQTTTLQTTTPQTTTSAIANQRASFEATDRTRTLRVDWLGCVPYSEGLRFQDHGIEAVKNGAEDRLLLLEHFPVITLGRGSSDKHVLESRERLSARGVEVVKVARGGDATYHGRGQLVGYLISNLRARGTVDVHFFLRELEAAVVDAVVNLGVPGVALEGRTGVFVQTAPEKPDRKLASIGVGVRHWVTHHGFALNVDIALQEFESIVPCGLHDIEMTSLEREGLGSGPALAARVRKALAKSFAFRFGVETT